MHHHAPGVRSVDRLRSTCAAEVIPRACTRRRAGSCRSRFGGSVHAVIVRERPDADPTRISANSPSPPPHPPRGERPHSRAEAMMPNSAQPSASPRRRRLARDDGTLTCVRGLRGRVFHHRCPSTAPNSRMLTCYGHDEPGIQFYSNLPAGGGNVSRGMSPCRGLSPTLNQSTLLGDLVRDGPERPPLAGSANVSSNSSSTRTRPSTTRARSSTRTTR